MLKKVVRIAKSLRKRQKSEYTITIVASNRIERMAALKAAMRMDVDRIVIDGASREEKTNLLSYAAIGIDIVTG